MQHLISLKCPSCMGRMEVAETADRVVCSFCGNQHLIQGVPPAAPANTSFRSEEETEVSLLRQDIAVLEGDLKRIYANRCTQLGYAALTALGGVGLVFLSCILFQVADGHSRHRDSGLVFIAAVTLIGGLVTLATGGTRMKGPMNPSAMETDLNAEITDLKTRLRRLLEQVPQRRMA